MTFVGDVLSQANQKRSIIGWGRFPEVPKHFWGTFGPKPLSPKMQGNAGKTVVWGTLALKQSTSYGSSVRSASSKMLVH